MGMDQGSTGGAQPLDDVLLRLQAGDLSNLSTAEREALLSELTGSSNVDELVRKSYEPLLTGLDRVPGAIQWERVRKNLVARGRGMAQDLIAAELFTFSASSQRVLREKGPDYFFNHFSTEAREVTSAKAEQEVERLVGKFRRNDAFPAWHVINTLLFVVFLFGVFATSDNENTTVILMYPWLLSVIAMGLFRFSKRFVTKLEESRAALREREEFFLEALHRGIIEELFDHAVTIPSKPAADPHWEPRSPLRPEVERQYQPVSKDARAFLDAERQKRESDNTARNRPADAAKLAKSKTARTTQTPHADAKKAEEMCAAWLRSRGDKSATTTQEGADGGVDVRSEKFVAQVKNYQGSVGAQPVREIHGVATAEGRKALFFTSGHYTDAALDFARSVNMPLIRYEFDRSRFEGANKAGSDFITKKI